MKLVRIFSATSDTLDACTLAEALRKRKRALREASEQLQLLENDAVSRSGDRHAAGSSSSARSCSPHKQRPPRRGRTPSSTCVSSMQPDPASSSDSSGIGDTEGSDADSEGALRQEEARLRAQLSDSVSELRAKKQKLEQGHAAYTRRLTTIDQRLEELREQRQILFKQLKQANEAEELARRTQQQLQPQSLLLESRPSATGAGEYMSFAPAPQHGPPLTSPFMAMQAPWPPPPPPPRRPVIQDPQGLNYPLGQAQGVSGSYNSMPLCSPVSPAAAAGGKQGPAVTGMGGCPPSPEPLEEGEMAPSPVSSGEIPPHQLDGSDAHVAADGTVSSAYTSAAVGQQVQRGHSGQGYHRAPSPRHQQQQYTQQPSSTASLSRSLQGQRSGELWQAGSQGLPQPDSNSNGWGLSRGNSWTATWTPEQRQQQQQQQQQGDRGRAGAPDGDRARGWSASGDRGRGWGANL